MSGRKLQVKVQFPVAILNEYAVNACGLCHKDIRCVVANHDNICFRDVRIVLSHQKPSERASRKVVSFLYKADSKRQARPKCSENAA